MNIHIEAVKKVKGRPTTYLKEYKTNITENEASKVIEDLRLAKTQYFEVIDPKKGIKTSFRLALSGKTYEQKVSKV